MSCGVDHRYSLDPALLWLWHWPAAVAPIQPLAWELPYATDVYAFFGPKKQKKKKKKKRYMHLYVHIHSNTIHNSQDMETT